MIQTVTGNEITGNHGDGIYLEYNTNAQIGRNILMQNGSYEIENRTSNNINARYNWWGDSTTGVMNSGDNPQNIATIFDYYDTCWQPFKKAGPYQ